MSTGDPIESLSGDEIEKMMDSYKKKNPPISYIPVGDSQRDTIIAQQRMEITRLELEIERYKQILSE